MHQRTKFSWCSWRQLACHSLVVNAGSQLQLHVWSLDPQLALFQYSVHRGLLFRAGCCIWSLTLAKQLLHPHTDSSLWVCRHSDHTQNNHNWRCCSWFVSPIQCRKNSFDLDPLHYHAKREVCTWRFCCTWHKCTRSDYLERFWWRTLRLCTCHAPKMPTQLDPKNLSCTWCWLCLWESTCT